ncbi:hypothetical protein QNA19_05945 [Rhodococcus fascians]|uniref:Unannotated protein n=1 Tax=freshwater metagenome TaxID=449393 RepID=A0A6J7F441_9ZZZZ|nr:hypothetical protein [Rhodococcus fascians]MDJ0425463.1 hypothetical protein [Rhodococcus fascians]MSX06168.1 hypothetical protein [Actinomycetota bacterium]
MPTTDTQIASSSLPDSRRERLVWGAAIAAVVVLGYLLVLSVDPRFFYIDDTESGAIPNWLQLGRIMRDGHFPSLVLDQWMAGNYPVEGQGGLWNPVQMAINYVSPSIDNLVLLATVVKLGFSILLAWGVYRVALVYGARANWAAVAGASAPFVGFTLFFENTSWVTALIGTAYITNAWASSVKYARGHSGPVVPFVFLYLAISVGYVHAAVMAGVMIGSVAIGERLFQRLWRPALKVCSVGIAAAACGAVTFLPGVLTSAVTWRSGDEGTFNDNFLTAPWSESLTASIPTAVTSIESWAGETTEAPVTYIAWFLVPALAFIAWRRVPAALRELAAPLILLAFALVFTAGPSDIGPIRWPARILPFVAIVALILVVTLISRYGTLDKLRPRLLAAGLLTLVLLLRAGSSGPEFFGRHIVAALAILLVGALALLLAHRFSTRATAALILVTIAPIAMYQVAGYQPPFAKWWLPTSQSEAKAQFPQWQGSTLQLGSRALTETEADGPDDPQLPWHSQVYGNSAKVMGLDYVNAYTPVGYLDFANLLCFEHEGSTCTDAFDRLFEIEPYTGKTYADLMQLDRVVLQKLQYPLAEREAAPAGWQWVTAPTPDSARQVYVLERVDGLIPDASGRVVATVNASADPISSDADSEHVTVSAPAGGSVVFSRLAWPGYTATLNGEPLQTKGLADIFLYVDLPPGTDAADLELTFRPPGERLGLAAMAGGVMVLIGLVVLDVRRRRRPSAPEFGSTTSSR